MGESSASFVRPWRTERKRGPLSHLIQLQTIIHWTCEKEREREKGREGPRATRTFWEDDRPHPRPPPLRMQTQNERALARPPARPLGRGLRGHRGRKAFRSLAEAIWFLKWATSIGAFSRQTDRQIDRWPRLEASLPSSEMMQITW